MGAFIPVKIEDHVQIPDYAKEIELLAHGSGDNNILQLSQLYSSRGMSYQGARSRIGNKDVNIRQLRTKSGQKSAAASDQGPYLEALTGVSIKLPRQVEVTIPSISPLQLSNLLKLL